MSNPQPMGCTQPNIAVKEAPTNIIILLKIIWCGGCQIAQRAKILAASPTPCAEELRASQIPDDRQKAKAPQIDT